MAQLINIQYTIIISIIMIVNLNFANGIPINQYQEMSEQQQKLLNLNDINDLEASHVKRAMADVKLTIKEVQKILETDPALPRLTRGEIEELFENVTREEFEKSLRKGDNNRAKHMRALMLVLPYNTNNYSQEKLQELYTRPPVTRVINSDPLLSTTISQPSTKSTTNNKPKRPLQKNTLSPDVKVFKGKPTTFHPKSSVPISTTATSAESSTAPGTTTSTTTTTTTTSTTTPTIKIQNPQNLVEKFSSHYKIDSPPFNPSQQIPPIRENVKDLLATIGLTAEIMPTTTTQHPPELTPELRELLNSFGLLTNEEPPKHLQYGEPLVSSAIAPLDATTSLDDFAEIVQEDFHPIPSYSFQQTDTFSIDDDLVPPPKISKSSSAPISPPTSSLPSSSTSNINGFREITQNYRMNDAPEMTPEDFSAFKPLPIPEEQAITSDMEEFLKSYGLLDSGFRHRKSMDDNDAVKILSIQEEQKLSEFPISTKLTPMAKMPEVSVDFLSPELMNVLGNIGISNKKSIVQHHENDVIKEIKTTISTNSNINSKNNIHPIYQSSSTKETLIHSSPLTEIEQFKEIPSNHKPEMRPVFISTSSPTQPPIPTSPPPTSPSTTTEINSDSNVSPIMPIPKATARIDENINDNDANDDDDFHLSDSDKEKLHLLMIELRKLEKLNRTLTEEDLENLNLQNYGSSLMKKVVGGDGDNLEHGPDPVANNDEFLIQKNEVKRQSTEEETTESQSPLRFTLNLAATTEEGFLDKEISDTVATTSKPSTLSSASSSDSISPLTENDDDKSSSPSMSTTSTSSTTTTTTTTTSKPPATSEERKSDSINTFNVGELDPVTETPLPPPRRNGFYFLADWNSFLEVGEDPDKVIVRFDPKIGDPSRFIPVTVP